MRLIVQYRVLARALRRRARISRLDCWGCSANQSRSKASAASRCRCALPMARRRSGRSRSGKCPQPSSAMPGDDKTHDAAIIGGGHNGLVCAAYLAMAGLKVVVLERRGVVGGAAVTEEFHPGFRNSVASYTVSLLSPKVISDLRLAEHGLRIVERRIANFLPLDDDRYLKVGGSRTHDEVAKFSTRDAERLDAYQARLEAGSDRLGALAPGNPPHLGKGPPFPAGAEPLQARRPPHPPRR